MSFTKLDYCQYLLSSPLNYTFTNLANHLEGISHDQINPYLRNEKLSPRLLWQNVKANVEGSENAYIINDVYAHHNRGVIRRSLGDNQGTLEDLNQVVRLASSSRAYYNRALPGTAMNDQQRTSRILQKPYGLSIPLHQPTLIGRYVCRRLIDREGAIEDLSQAVRLEPNNATAFYNRGLFIRDLGNRQGAFEDVQKSVDLFQQQGDTCNHQKALEVLEHLQQSRGLTNATPNSSKTPNTNQPIF